MYSFLNHSYNLCYQPYKVYLEHFYYFLFINKLLDCIYIFLIAHKNWKTLINQSFILIPYSPIIFVIVSVTAGNLLKQIVK